MLKVKKQALIQELAKRELRLAFSPDIFAQQRAVIEDPSKFKALVTSRRAGKSTTAAVYLYEEAIRNANCSHHYIGLTRKSCKKILWKELKSLNKKYKLNIKFNNTDLIAELSNGSDISLVGGNDEAAVETIRGEKSRLVVVDEAGSYRSHLKYLLDEVITPMLIDYEGTLCLMGTPTASCAGPFFDATTGVDTAYSVHKWTLLNNPFIPHASRWLEEYKKKKGWTDDNPIYQREWCGKWIKSFDSIVYKYLASVNDLKDPPKGKYNYLIGVDIGYNDATAFVVGAYRDHDPTFYIVKTFKKSSMTVDQIMGKLNELITDYNPDKVVMDSGGGGKLVAESFRKRYSIPVKPAQKKDKRDFIEQMNSDFLSGRIKVLPGNEALTEEWEIIQWDEDKKREDEKFVCDLADACLYTWRESVHYTETPKEEPPQVASDAWYERQIKEMEAQAEAEYQRRQQEAEDQAASFGNYPSDED